MNISTRLHRDVFSPFETPDCFYSDEVSNQEANYEGHQSSNSNNFNNASDSNGESVKHRWNYAPYYPKIRQSKEWTIAILLKLSLVSWDMWTYRIGYRRTIS